MRTPQSYTELSNTNGLGARLWYLQGINNGDTNQWYTFPIYVHRRVYFTSNFSIAIQIQWKIGFSSVMTCAKFYSDDFTITWMRPEISFHGIWNMAEILVLKWDPWHALEVPFHLMYWEVEHLPYKWKISHSRSAFLVSVIELNHLNTTTKLLFLQTFISRFWTIMNVCMQPIKSSNK